MTGVVVGGATGRLGNIICRMISESEDLDLIGAVVSDDSESIGKEVFGVEISGRGGLLKLLENADVYVDVTLPHAAAETIADIPGTGCNLIVGTTSIPKEKLDLMTANTEKFGTSSLVSSNFAIGINVFWKVCEVLAELLPDYDIEVIESHHNQKKDAPSGTAAEVVRRLKKVTGAEETTYGRDGITGPRGKEIGVHVIRAGDIVGNHTVLFAKNAEVIELTHRAASREVLAAGCLSSIRWIANKKDGRVHSMEEVLGIC